MHGFHPQKNKAAKVMNYANGGIVKGPGTGTSDDVSAMVPTDGYIMPADSTQALGFKPGMRPAQVSNGEAVLTPEQVQQAGGFQALDAMKAATHTPVPERGTEGPKFFFANGTDGDELSKPFMPVLPQSLQNGMTKMYGAGMPAPGAGNMAAGAGRGVSVPGVPPVTRERDVRQAQMAADASQRAASQAETDARYADTGAQEAAAARAAFSTKIGNSAVRPYRDPAAAPVAATTQPVAPVRPPPQAAGFPIQRPATATPAAAAPLPSGMPEKPGTPAAQANAQAPTGNVNVQRQANGVMSFSGQDVAGDVSYNGARAAGFRPGGAGVSVVPSAPGLGFQPAQQAQDAPGARMYVGPDTGGFGLLDKDRIQQRNLQMDMQQRKPGSPTALKSFLQQQAAAPGQQIERDRMAAEVAAGDANRALKSEELGAERGFRAGQLANDTARLGLEGQRVGSEVQARGFEINQAKRLETLRAQYEAATDPKTKAELAQKLRTLAGKDDQANKFTVVPGGQEFDAVAGVMRNVPARVLNNQTGQFVDGQSGAKQPPARDSKVVTDIVNDTSLSIEQRAEKLRSLGFQ